MKTLVEELDRPGDGAGVWAVPVEHRDPDALIEVLTPLLATPASGATPAREPKLVADRRSRAVFVVGAAADYQRVAALVGVLDRDQGDGAAMTAIRLRNARASEVVAALAPLTSGGGGDKAVVGTVKLAADEGTNAVLIQASPQDTLAVRAMLDELDAPRRQVYVEAMVLEVSEATNRALGAAWHLGSDTSDGGVALGGFQTTTLSSVTAATSLANAGAGVLGGILGTGRLADDREIMAIGAAGLSPVRLVRVPVVIGLALAGLGTWLSLEVEPAGLREAQLRFNELIKQNVTANVRAGTFFEEIPQFTVYAEQVGPEGWTNVLISDRTDPAAPMLALARRGRLEPVGAGEEMRLVLEAGELHREEAQAEEYVLAAFRRAAPAASRAPARPPPGSSRAGR